VKESEWLSCTDLERLLKSVRGRASGRKLRLFAVACCRRIWHLLTDERSRRSVEAAQRLADGLETDTDLGAAYDAAFAVFQEQVALGGGTPVDWEAAFAPAPFAAAWVAHPDPDGDFPLDVAGYTAYALQAQSGPETPEEADQCRLLRDIIGNPFRPVAFDPAWLRWNDGLVVRLAQSIYDDTRFEDLPILADALEEVGCAEPNILAHCRGGGEHVRGCWAVDLILGKC
jgi:hypothetical protein